MNRFLNDNDKVIFFRRWVPLIFAFTGALLTAIVFFILKHNAEDAFRATFNQKAARKNQEVSREFERQIEKLEGLQRFIESQNSIDRRSFNLYVTPLLKEAHVRALEWAPRVSSEEIDSFEKAALQDGFSEFSIFEKDPQGKKSPVPKNRDVFPVYFLEPLKGNEAALGFDLASETIRRTAMEQSRDKGTSASTPPLTLLQDGKKKTGILVLMPVFNINTPPQTIEERRHSLKGFVLAVYNADDFLKNVYSKTSSEMFSCLIEDVDAPIDRRILYQYTPDQKDINWDKAFLRYESSLNIAGRSWRMTMAPGDTFAHNNLSKSFWLVLPIGFIFTGLITAFLFFLASARYRAEALIKARTEELKKEKELLQTTKEDFHLILESAAEGIYGINLDGCCTFCNSSCLKMLGYTSSQELLGKNMHYQIHHSYIDKTPHPIEKCQLFLSYKENVKVHGEEVFWRADKTPFFAEVWSYPEIRNGKVVGAVVSFLDITERKATEEALIKREAYLTSIFDNFPYLVWLKDFDGRFLAVNNIFAKSCGLKTHEVIGKNDFDIWPKLFAEKYCADDVKVIRNRVKMVTEELIEQKDGRKYFETYKSPIFDKKGRVIGTTGFSHDITERKNAEEALKEGEARYRNITSAITNYIYTVYVENGTPSGTNYNPACLAMTGYSSEEFLSDPMLWIKIVPEEDRPIVKRQIEDIFSGKKEINPIEHRIIHKDSKICWVKNSIVPHYDAHDQLISYDGLITDITARREAERVLEDQKRTLDEHAIVSKTDAQGRITYVNDKFCEISKFTREELIGETHKIINSGYHPKAFFANLWHTISHGRVWQGKIRNVAKDGTVYWVQSTIVPFLDEYGKIKEYISARTDITQNLENEERLEKAMQVKSSFISTVSHELRTPLASIKSSIDILNTEVPGKLTGDQKTFIGRVKANIDRLARLINDVLDLSKLESGKMTMNLIPVRPEEIVKDVVEMQKTVVKDKNILLETNFEPELPLLMADKDRLTQVFNNLINNALKFTSQGKVSVSISMNEDRTMMRFCVSDTGPGIKEEDLVKLFQKFQQVGGVSQQVSGTGLGLAICKEITERHGGRIWVESEFGKGSSFIFLLPLNNNRRVLVVDDDKATVHVIRNVLNNTNKYKIEAALDGFEAGQKYLEFDPQIIILDIGLPKLSGLDVCARIKKDPKTMKTKIIMISSFTDEMEKKAWAAGADEILSKPIVPRELMIKIDSLF